MGCHVLGIPQLPLLHLPVVSGQDQPDDEGQDSDEEGGACGGAAAGDVSRAGRRRVHVRAVNVGAIADHVGEGDAGAAFDERSGERVGDPSDNDLVAGYGAHLLCR